MWLPRNTAAHHLLALTSAALMQEERQGWEYDYIVFMDDDVSLADAKRPAEQLRAFEAFLAEHQPAVGVPWYGCAAGRPCEQRKARGDAAFPSFHTDHIMIAYHRSVRSTLWPLQSEFDPPCWWTSQWMQTTRASLLYPGRVLADPRFVVVNKVSRSYPRAECPMAFCRGTEFVLRALPPEVLHNWKPHPWFISSNQTLASCFDRLISFIRDRNPTFRVPNAPRPWNSEEEERGSREDVVVQDDDCWPAEHMCLFSESRRTLSAPA
jgi:hypothetical protein